MAENNFSHLYLSVGTKIHLPGDHTSVKIVGEVTENNGEKFSERLKIRAGVTSMLTKNCKMCCGVEIKPESPWSKMKVGFAMEVDKNNIKVRRGSD